MSTPFSVQIPRRIVTDMVEQAQAERPRECCGLLAGRPATEAGGTVRIEQRYPLTNAAANPEREYSSDPQSLFTAVRSMRALGLEIVGI